MCGIAAFVLSAAMLWFTAFLHFSAFADHFLWIRLQKRRESGFSKCQSKERNVPLLISVIIIIALTGLDQLTKHLATVYLAPVRAMPFIPGVMELRYVLNDGAAFSMLADAEWGRVFLIVVTGLALAALAVYFFWKKPSSWLERWVFILIFSGGLGNLMDRVLNGYVVDFFATTFMNFAVFNVADCFVCVGAALFVIAVLRQELNAKKEQKAGTDENA